MRALGKMFGRAGARGWYAARAVSASARAAGDALGGPRAFVSERVGIPRFVSHVVSRTTSSRPFSGPAARRPQPRPRGFASAGTPRDDRDATAVETDASATGERDAVTASNAVETEKKAPVTDASTPTPPTPSPRVPLDGTSSTETDGVHAVKVVQNTWWEALTMTPVYAFRATRAKWASAPAVAAAIDPGFDADAFSRLAAVGRDEVLRAYAANDMSRVRAMCTPAVFDAFQQSRIEYERNNLALRYDRSPSADEETRRDDPGSSASSLCSARLIDLRLARQEDTFTGDPEDDPVWVARRDRCRAFVNGVGSGAREATSVMSDGQTLAPEKTKTKTKFDSLESADAKPLRLVATVFAMDKTGSRWSIEDTVNGTVGITEDLRIQEWSFTRDLPRYWPSDEALETPWRVEHVG